MTRIHLADIRRDDEAPTVRQIIREYGAWRMLADFAGMALVLVVLAIGGVMVS